MSNACRIRGRNVSIRIHDSGGTEFNLTGTANDFSITLGTALLDSTTYGDGTETGVAGTETYTVTFSGYWAGSGADSTASKLMALNGASQGTWFNCAPAGSTAGCADAVLQYSGCVNLENLTYNHPRNNLATYSFTLKPRSGSLTVVTASW
jgi:hypothetical protein